MQQQELVLQCYKADPGRTLECSDLVKEYIKCAGTAREVNDLSQDTLPPPLHIGEPTSILTCILKHGPCTKTSPRLGA